MKGNRLESITLITPTSDRPVAFALCERWMARQTYAGEVRWIVVDDGATPVECTRGQTHVCLHAQQERVDSFRMNLLAGLLYVETPLVAIIEDDDWYHPDYLAELAKGLEGRDIYGEGRAKYYNVSTRRHRVHGNISHASLCQTGFRAGLVGWLRDHIRNHRSIFVDLALWQHAPTPLKHVAPDSRHAVGIKGLPGKAGIGIGHRMDERFPVDADGSILNSWIGKEDAEVYASLHPVS